MRVLQIDISSKVSQLHVTHMRVFIHALSSSHADVIAQANQLLRAEKRFKDFEDSVAQTNDQYQRQVRRTPGLLNLASHVCP